MLWGIGGLIVLFGLIQAVPYGREPFEPARSCRAALELGDDARVCSQSLLRLP